MDNYIFRIMSERPVNGYPRPIEFIYDDLGISLMASYDALRNKYRTNLETDNYIPLPEKLVDKYIENEISKRDVDALSDVLKVYYGLKFYFDLKGGRLNPEEVGKEYFKNQYVKYSHVIDFINLRHVIVNIEDEDTRLNYMEPLNKFEDFITRDGGWDYRYCDQFKKKSYPIYKCKDTAAFAQFMKSSISEIFKVIDRLDYLEYAENEVKAVHSGPFGYMFTDFQKELTEEKIKEFDIYRLYPWEV